MNKQNWFKNLIFENTETKPEQSAKVESQTSRNTAAPTQPPPVRSQAEKPIDDTATIIGTVDKTLLNKLCIVLDEQTSEGIDYLKFKKSVDSLKNIQPEENLRFTTAFLTLKATTPSLSKEYLIQTIDKYVALMEQERKVGINELKTLRSKNIDTKEKEISDARGKMEKMKAEIQQLTRFISETEALVIAKKNEITIKEADFNATIDNIVKQLQNDRTKIETIIK
jgi:hypothetical protein